MSFLLDNSNEMYELRNHFLEAGYAAFSFPVILNTFTVTGIVCGFPIAISHLLELANMIPSYSFEDLAQ